ncbi:M16 family metallopeptidase [Vibrio sp. TRT 17S01]|uniref:M16 family metallopeptidase n=1 Tax=Vibrio sp. TRT 17S01 TaxID=3418505 RepID=UPI003CF86FCC
MKKLFLLMSLFMLGCSQSNTSTPIEADPLWAQGELDNGLKYHIRSVDDAPVSLRLFFHIGSFEETEQQLGYAHFVEHMAFNGSKHFTANDVITLFEKSGATFGADINAHTDYHETVYKLDLPDKTDLDTALLWFRDIADGLTFPADEVEKEKGVILGEFRRHRPENKSLAEKVYEKMIAGSGYEHRDPIGTKEIVETATSDSLNAFYQQWYQPQYAEIVLTGDITAEQARAMIAEKFKDWQATHDEPLPEKPKLKLKTQDFVDVVSEFESPSLSINIHRGDGVTNTRSSLIEYWLDDIAQQLIAQRLNNAFTDAAIPAQSIYSETYYSHGERYSVTGTSFPAADRAAAQGLFIGELASLRDHGVFQSEADAILSYYHELLKHVAFDWSKLTAVDFAEERSIFLSVSQLNQSEDDYRQSLKQLLNEASLKRLNQQIHSLLSAEKSFELGLDESESMVELQNSLPDLKEKFALAGVMPLAMAVKESGLKEPENMGVIVSRNDETDNFVIWKLSNGIEVWFQQDQTAGDTANVFLTSIGGKAALEPDLFAAAELAIPVVTRSGIANYSGAQFDSYLRTNNISVHPFIGFTRHGIEIVTPKDKIGEALKVLYNIHTDIKVEPKQIETVKKEFYQDLDRYYNSPVGQWNRQINANTYQPQSRHHALTNPDLALVTDKQIQDVHTQLFGKLRNNKLVIIADLEPSQLIHVLRTYAAAISFEPADIPSFNVAYIESPQSRIQMAVNNEKSTNYLLRVTNRSATPGSARLAFVDDLIQRLLVKRLDSYVREELGLDYAPTAFSASQDSEPSTDWFIEAQVAPSDVVKIETAIDKVVHTLGDNITQEELNIVAKQLAIALRGLENEIADRGWFYSRYLIHGYGIDILQNVEASSYSITLDEVKQRLNEAFGQDAMFVKYVLSPE